MNQNQTLVMTSKFAKEVVLDALSHTTKQGYDWILSSTVEEVATNMIEQHPDAFCFEPWEIIPHIIEWKAKKLN